MQEISVIPDRFAPTSSFAGNESPAIIRGSNVRIIRAGEGVKIENYVGSKNLSEYIPLAPNQITGTVGWAAGSTTINGAGGTLFLTELHIGQMVYTINEVFVVRRIISDTVFVADRAATALGAGATAYRLPTMFELAQQRAVLMRGNAIPTDKRDVILVGDGELYFNGVASGFTATRRPKRLVRQTDGTFIENPIGYTAPPTVPTIVAAVGGTKGMQAGKYSHMFTWWNGANEGFSDPSAVVKTDSGTALDLTIVAGGRFLVDFTNTYARIVIASANVTNSGGHINFAIGSGHNLVDGDTIKIRNFGGASTSDVTELRTYFVEAVDANNFKLRRTSAALIAFTSAGTGDYHIYKCPANATGVKVGSSQSGGGVVTVNQSNFSQGAWLKSVTIEIEDLDVDGKAYFEYLDAEMGETISGDNDMPPECELVTEFANQYMYISAFGLVTTGNRDGTSPGNYVVPSKLGNPEAAPSKWRVSVGDVITGFANGIGRLFTMTANGLPFITSTGRTELARLNPTMLDLPFTSRPFWTKGGINPHNIIVIQGDVFIYTGRSIMRSPSNAGENSVPFEIGLPVAELTKEWFDGHVFLGHCGKNQQLCLISSATHKVGGYWVSQILPYDLQRNEWQPVITLSAPAHDLVVSGCATVAGRLEFLAGGVDDQGARTFRTGTYRYDEFAGEDIPYYFAIQPNDLGEESRQKYVKSVRTTGKVTNASIGIYGARAGENIDVADLENGTNDLGTYPLADSAGIERSYKVKRLVKRLQVFSVRFEGTWEGSGGGMTADDVDRIDEIVVECGVHGVRQ